MAAKDIDDSKPDDRDSEETSLDMSQAAVKRMIAEARERGYITYDQLNTVLPPEQVSSEQIEDVMSMLSEMGINVIEDDEVEGQRRVQSVRTRIGQRIYDAIILKERRWPAMGEDQGKGIGLFRAHMHEVDRLSLDQRGELRIGIEPRLSRPPVKPLPGLGQFADEADDQRASQLHPAWHGCPTAP